MPDTHSTTDQIRALQLCLSADKRPLGFFLGAGCPLSVLVDDGGTKKRLIPDVVGLTTSVSNALSADAKHATPLGIVQRLCTTTTVPKPTVETYLNLLRNIQALGGTDEIRGITPATAVELDQAICKCIASEVDKRLPESDTSYHTIARWIRGVPRSGPIELFTPNYDLLFEEAMEWAGIPYFDGFVGSNRAFLDIESMEKDFLPARWVRLWKLHGSVNWYQNTAGKVWRGKEERGSKLLVYPSNEKYLQSRKMPFLAMHDRLKSFLNRPGAVLVVCGYSFVDDHFNEILRVGLRGNSSAVVFALSYPELDEKHPGVPLAEESPNFLLLGPNAGIVGGVKKLWEPDPATKAPMKFALGDFAELGKLLASISGQGESRGTLA